MEWILVPKNPTEEMIKAGESWSGLPSTTWADMLDAAPIPPALSFVVEAVSQAVTDDPFEGSWDERLEHVLSKIRNELSTYKPPTKLTEDDKADLRRVLGEAIVKFNRAGIDFPCSIHEGPMGKCNPSNCKCH